MNKLFVGVAVVALVVSFVALGYALNPPFVGGGLSPTASDALNQQRLINAFTSSTLPLSGINTTTTASITWPAFATAGAGPATSTLSTSTGIGVAAAAGDLVFVSPTTISATSSVSYTAAVYTASTTNATILINAHNGTSTVWTPPATTFNVWVLPAATFKRVNF